jgi:hypothetical protein
MPIILGDCNCEPAPVPYFHSFAVIFLLLSGVLSLYSRPIGPTVNVWQRSLAKDYKMTIAAKFIQTAHKLMPHMVELRELDASINEANQIDEVMFSKGEYLGGMAAVILAIIAKEA